MALSGKTDDLFVPAETSGSPPSMIESAPLLLPPKANARRPELNPYVKKLETLPELIIPFVSVYQHRGRWQSRFPTVQPLYLELGAGYGHFLLDMARRHPERNFLGLELKYKRVYRGAEKVRDQGLTNIQFMRFDALILDQAFMPEELEGVYINFPDPWPKSHHAVKRMVSPQLVARLEQLLTIGGQVQLKSDYEPYRELFPEAFVGSGFEQTGHVADLGAWSRPEENIQTTYEKRFRKQGLPCFFYEFTLRERRRLAPEPSEARTEEAEPLETSGRSD